MPKPFLSPTASILRVNLGASRLRALLQRGEIAIIGIAAVIGVAAALLIAAMDLATHGLHLLVFGSAGALGTVRPDPVAVLTGPTLGGLAVGLLLWWAGRRRSRRSPVDPIEANALYGGRMSVRESLIICAQNILSNGAGASVGMEAAYTQIASAVASRAGMAMDFARGEMRLLVGCGAGAAISAAFDAPLTGAFYGIEVIVGTYSSRVLAPIIVSSLLASLVSNALTGPAWVLSATGIFWPLQPVDFAPAIALALICAAVGIALMQTVALVEQGFRQSRVPPVLRPALGGLAVGLLALISPQVLGAGHDAMHMNLAESSALLPLLGLVVLKALASALSIGAGFRGGLFFASLFLGVLVGQAFAQAANLILPAPQSVTVFAIIGMSALGAAVVGGPLSMTFLALEMTGDFGVTLLVLGAVTTTSVIVRNVFGYSFATWRFHLRGETIRSAHDVGWIRDLTVGRIMRADTHTVPVTTTVSAFLEAFPPGSTQRVIATDEGRYAGLVMVAEMHGLYPDPAEDLRSHLRLTDEVLLPSMNAHQAVGRFDATRSEALVVVDGFISRRPIGLLTEAHTLRRYSETLDQQRRDIAGID